MKEILTIAFFVIGNLIGAGFFCLPSLMAPLGYGMFFSWLISVSMALIFALIFGELAIIKQDSGLLSDYMDAYDLKKSVAYFYYFFAVVSNMALLNPNGLMLFGSKVFLSFIIILIITLINHFFKYETIANIEIIVTSLKFALLIILPVYLFFSHPDLLKFPNFCGKKKDIFHISITAFFSFIGIETAGIFGKDKNMKYGMIIGILATFFLYLISSFIIVGMVPLNEIEKQMPFVSLMEICGYSSHAVYISYLIAFVCACTLYGWISATGKLSLEYSQDGLFDKSFLYKTRSNTSLLGLWTSSILLFLLYLLCEFLGVSNKFEFIADISVYMLFLLYGLCAYKLSQITESDFYYIISWIGLILIAITMCIDVFKSFIAIIFFVFLYLYEKIYMKKSVDQ